jgi:hypothetical protein
MSLSIAPRPNPRAPEKALARRPETLDHLIRDERKRLDESELLSSRHREDRPTKRAVT